MNILESDHLSVKSPENYVRASRWLFDPYLNRRSVEVAGLENLPGGSAPYILAANHRSLLDIPVLGKVLLAHDGSLIHFVAKKELWETHQQVIHLLERKLKVGHKIAGLAGNWFGDALADYFESTSTIKFDRDKKMSQQPEVGEAMNYVLQHNGVLGMFPEHTRRKGPRLQVEKKGLGMLAVANFVPIVTAGIYGTEARRGPIYVKFGETIQPGPIGSANKRLRMVEMETEYQSSLQKAILDAHAMAGVDSDLYELEQAA